ncbi:RNA polymerase sigma factor [Pseudonocardia sp. GCM10023141]|uniref:RNA polymerase sigma factor n=1 Tax=Pseudonocardia sp. GCM10023141 TaxID=3252653 RepID=UPI00362066C2
MTPTASSATSGASAWSADVVDDRDRRGTGPANLLQAAATGDAQAWSTIVEQHERMLWSIARSYRLSTSDAGDAVQATWLRLVENLDRITAPESLGAWLATTLRRECLRQLRVARRLRSDIDVEALDVADPDPDPHAVRLLTDERNAALWRALASLRPRDQQLLRMLMANPTPCYAAVARALGMPIGSIGPARRRALDLLRQAAVACDLAACDGVALRAS